MKGNYEALIHPRIMVMRIIVIALFLGVVAFAGVASMLHFTKEPPRNPPAAGAPAQPDGELPIVGYLGVFALAMAVAVRFFLPQIMTPALGPPGSIFAGDAAVEESMVVERLIAFYQTQLIILAAMTEGAAFMLLVSLQAFDTTWTLPIAGFAMLWLFSYFPSYDGLVSWLDDQVLMWRMRKE